MRHPKDILKSIWGFDAFRGSQETIIDALLEKRDVLALMPTGGGKSLCFQIPALVQEGICIVVSPLIALIHNQVDRLDKLGIKAIALTGGIPIDEVINLLDNCCFGNYKFLYLSPERLKQEIVRERLKQMNVNLVAIDEAHCISQWGHDFRPAYLECSMIRELLPDIPIIALTATATEPVSYDIMAILGFDNALVVKDSFARDNIAFSVSWTDDKRYRLKQLCTSNRKSAIVYVTTRRAAQDLAQYLNQNGCTSTFFHGGIAKKEKKKRLDLWLGNQVPIMVATNAFGMGIDKPDVALVVHYQIPDCIENYFQEAGRAGRDGKNAKAVILTNKTDEQQLRNQFLSVLPDTAYIKKVYGKLNSYFQIAFGEGNDETYQFNFNAFCETYQLNTMLTFNAIRILDQNSVVALEESFTQKTSVQVLVGKQPLFDYLSKNREIVPITQTMLRSYGGIFDFITKINPVLIAKKAGTSESKVLLALQQLHKDGIIDYIANESDLSLTFLVPREDDSTINRFAREVRERHLIKERNIDSILEYIKNDEVCRNKQLLGYFGEVKHKNCGICDVCLTMSIPSVDTNDQIIRQLLKLLAHSSSDSRTLIAALNHRESDVLTAIRYLLEDGLIRINSKNQYEIV